MKGYNQGPFYGIQVPASQTMGRWVIISREKLQKWSLEFFRLLHWGGKGGGQLYKDNFYQIRVGYSFASREQWEDRYKIIKKK